MRRSVREKQTRERHVSKNCAWAFDVGRYIAERNARIDTLEAALVARDKADEERAVGDLSAASDEAVRAECLKRWPGLVVVPNTEMPNVDMPPGEISRWRPLFPERQTTPFDYEPFHHALESQRLADTRRK